MKSIPAEKNGCGTYLQKFERLVSLYRDEEFLGSREKKEDGTFGDYKWLTYGDVEDLAQNLARGIRKLDLAPQREGDG